MKSSCSNSPRAAVADLDMKKRKKVHAGTPAHAHAQVWRERRVIFVQLFPLRSSSGSWPITIVIIKSSPLQVRDIKDDNVSIIFKVPAAPLPPRTPAAATLMRASQDGRQRLLRTQNAITPNPPLLIGRRKPTEGPEVAPVLPYPAVDGWMGEWVGEASHIPPTSQASEEKPGTGENKRWSYTARAAPSPSVSREMEGALPLSPSHEIGELSSELRGGNIQLVLVVSCLPPLIFPPVLLD